MVKNEWVEILFASQQAMVASYNRAAAANPALRPWLHKPLELTRAQIHAAETPVEMRMDNVVTGARRKWKRV